MKTLLLTFLLLSAFFCTGQVVFSEAFDEADNAITGSDAIGPVVWNAVCPGSVNVNDYFKVVSNKLEAKDTNSPASEWETGNFDISACTGLTISFDIEELSNMEECASCGGTGIICIDWVKLEYNIDGTGWTEVVGVTCPLVESPGEMIQIGDIAGGGPIAFTSPCIDIGTTLAIRISCMSWASAEIWRFDNIIVECTDCILPVQIDNLTAKESRQGVLIDWSTLQEESNDYFMLERSYDGKSFDFLTTIDGAGNSSEKIDYQYEDLSVNKNGVVYYRLKQFDFDGENTYSKTVSIELTTDATIYYSPNYINYAFKKSNSQAISLTIYNLEGKLIHQEWVKENGAIEWDKKGFFIVEIPSLGLHQKLSIY